MKGEEINLIDVRGRCPYTDILLLVSGTSDRHVNALAEKLATVQEVERSKNLVGRVLASAVVAGASVATSVTGVATSIYRPPWTFYEKYTDHLISWQLSRINTFFFVY